jgi:hypothetical protein
VKKSRLLDKLGMTDRKNYGPHTRRTDGGRKGAPEEIRRSESADDEIVLRENLEFRIKNLEWRVCRAVVPLLERCDR